MPTISAPACPFCALSAERIVHCNELAVAIRDGYPIARGHTLVLPRRHVGRFFDLERQERDAVLELLDAARGALDLELRPAGYNIGINDGQAAGQTIPHVHVHLIPRFAGDQPDPRGGVRWIFPDKADYWSTRSRDEDGGTGPQGL